MKSSTIRPMLRGAIAAATLVASTAAATAPPAATKTASMDLFARASNPNPTLNSYTASAQLSALLHAIIPIHKTFNGTVYYLRPTRKIEFQNVPGPLSQFKELAQTTPSYEQAMLDYAITPETDDGHISTYSLVPKKSGGRVKSITITITDRTALLKTAHWFYTNNGNLLFAQHYHEVGNFHLPWKATIDARFPGYSVDGTLTFSNYQLNATVPPSIFASPSASPKP
jgi:hypothetical protein